MKIHCAQLVEGALRSALDPASATSQPAPAPAPGAASLLDSFTKPKEGGVRVVFLEKKPAG